MFSAKYNVPSAWLPLLTLRPDGTPKFHGSFTGGIPARTYLEKKKEKRKEYKKQKKKKIKLFFK